MSKFDDDLKLSKEYLNWPVWNEALKNYFSDYNIRIMDVAPADGGTDMGIDRIVHAEAHPW